MDEAFPNSRLSQIETRWTLMFQAHESPGDAATGAQKQLLQCYGAVVYQYMLGIVRDADAAEELTQEFALHFLRGDFRGVDPQRGRFRDFLKTALRNLVVDHLRKRNAQPQMLSASNLEHAVADNVQEGECSFREIWRDELLVRAWQKLASAQEATGEPIYHALRCRSENPELRSAELAELLTKRLGRPLTANGIRQALHRAREKFTRYLLDAVAESLAHPNSQEVEDELIDLGLLAYCQPALARCGFKP